MNIELDDAVVEELGYMIELHKQHGAPVAFDSVQELVNYILISVADGSRRPGAWERQMLDMMGLVADCNEHHMYRATYGKPEIQQ